MGRRILVSLILGIILLVPAGLGSNQAYGHGSPGTPITGVIFFTTFSDIGSANCGPGGAAAVGPCAGLAAGPFRVFKVAFSWDGSTLTFPGGVTPVALTAGADGIVQLPNGNFAIASQSSTVHEITTAGAAVTTLASGTATSFHLGLNPAATDLYVAGIPGSVGKMPVLGGLAGAGAANAIGGSVGVVTSIAWDGAGLPFYTSSAGGGAGTFGSFDLPIMTTTLIFAPVKVVRKRCP